MKTKRLWMFLTAVLLVAFTACKKDTAEKEKIVPQTFENTKSFIAWVKTQIQEISVDALRDSMEHTSVRIIDVRPEVDHGVAYIPHSVSIARGSLEFNIDNKAFWTKNNMNVPAKDELIVVYCKKGNRSALAAETLMRLGYTRVYSLKGGFSLWKLHFHDFFETNLPPGVKPPEEAEEGGC